MKLPERSAPDDAAQNECCLVMTTTDSQAHAESLAARLVEGGLAACVQILPVKSVYRWRGELQRDDEWLLLVKSMAARFDEIDRFIRASHPYQTPEVTMLAIDGGSSDYLNWLVEAVAPRT